MNSKFAKYKLSDCKENVLAKGTNSNLAANYVNYDDYFAVFEWFYRNIIISYISLMKI